MKITVNKNDLFVTLKKNRANHAELFQSAIEKYRAKAIAHFNDQVDLIKLGKDFSAVLNLPRPEEHTDDYDRAIKMMEWAQGDTIELDEDQFEMYVMDRWGWHRSFALNTTSYLGR